MRRFELFLVFGALFAVGWPAVFGVRTRRGIVSVVLLALFVIHAQVEGLRWQMMPLYGTALGLAIGDIIVVERRLDWTSRIARGIFGVAGVGLAAVLPLVLPVPELPLPSGPQAIGTVTFDLVDPEREATYGPAPGGPRRLRVQVWYPAEPEEDVAPTPWSQDWDVVAPAVSTLLGYPGWFLNYTRYTDSHAGPSLSAAAGTFPIVIYSHGWTGFRTNAVNQIENLVSHGYVVVALDHTFSAVTTRFEDGDVVPYDPAALPNEADVDEEAYDEASRNLMEVYVADLVTVLNALDQGELGPFGAVAASADVSRIGIYGQSTGGGAAVEVCLIDERCDAVLGLDAWVEPIPDRTIATSATRPALYMRSDEWRDTENDAVLRGIAERSENITYWVGVEGANHNDFTVAPLLSPVTEQLGLTGTIPAGRVIPIVDRYVLGFFDVFLLDTGSAALDTASFDEVSVEVIRPG
jgi:predicted dienelactone hydrolase